MQPVYPHHPGHRAADTSQEAAQSLAKRAGSKVRDLVLEAIRISGTYGATSEEIASRLRLPYHTVQPRTSELIRLGEIRDSGVRRLNRLTGKKAIVWVRA